MGDTLDLLTVPFREALHFHAVQPIFSVVLDLPSRIWSQSVKYQLFSELGLRFSASRFSVAKQARFALHRVMELTDFDLPMPIVDQVDR
jgi:hypothetical protein